MAFDFDGATDRIDYTTAQIDISALSAMTVSFWVYRDTASGNSEYFVSFENGTTAGPMIIWLEGISGRMALSIQHSVTAIDRTAASSPTDNTWENWIVTWDGTTNASGCHIYKNNVEESYDISVDGDGTLSTSGNIRIGGRSADDNRNFDGKLANPGIWGRVISAGERAGLTAGYSPEFYPNELLFAPRLIRNAQDRITSDSGTLDGTSVFPHPRTILPSQQIYVPYTAVAGGQYPTGSLSLLGVGL